MTNLFALIATIALCLLPTKKETNTPALQPEKVFTIKLTGQQLAIAYNAWKKSTAPFNEVEYVMGVVDQQVQAQIKDSTQKKKP
jgi:hypothetical protein